MGTHQYKKFGIGLAIFYWFFDSSVHKVFYGEDSFEIIPSEFNELWMRTVIFLLVIILGCYADHHTKRIVEKDEEKIRVYRASVSATHHILNNFLNKMLLFRMKAEKSQDFDQETLTLYDQVINEAKVEIKKMEEIKEVSENAIQNALNSD